MSLNKCLLIGRLGSNPETRYSQSGTPITNFSIATNEHWTNREGKSQESTEWHRVVSFNRLAEICRDNLAKGRQVYVEGRIQTRLWEDRDGNKRSTTEVVANTIRFLGSKPQEERVSQENSEPVSANEIRLSSDDAEILSFPTT